MRIPRSRLPALALLFWLVLPTGHAVAETEAVNALQGLRFAVKVGDGATVVSTLPGSGPTDEFEMRYRYEVVEQRAEGGFVVSVRMLGASKPGQPQPAGFDRAMATVFPPVRILTDSNFQPLSVQDWVQTKQAMKDATSRLSKKSRAFLGLMIFVFPIMQSEELLLSLLRSMTDLHPSRFKKSANGVTVKVERRNGQSTVTGTRSVTPVAIVGDTVAANMSTDYDTTELAAKNPFMKFALSGGGSMTMKSTGLVMFNRSNGWVAQMEERLVVRLVQSSGKVTTKTETLKRTQEPLKP